MKQKIMLPIAIAVIVIMSVVVAIAFIPSQQTEQNSVQNEVVKINIETGIIRSSEDGVGVDLGETALDFALQDKDGNVVKLSDFRGKIVFLNFWASWCPFCINEIPDIVEASDELDDEMVVLFVNRGETVAAGQTYIDAKIPVEVDDVIVYDTSEEVYREYGFGNFMPISFVIDEDGVIQDRKFGPITKEEIIEKVNKVIGS